MSKDIENIKKKSEWEKKGTMYATCEQFIEAFFEIYTPEYIKLKSITEAKNEEIFMSSFTVDYELDLRSAMEHKKLIIVEEGNRYKIYHSYDLKDALESGMMRSLKQYKKKRKELKGLDFNFKFRETKTPYDDGDGKYKGTIELELYKVKHYTVSSWLEYNL